MELKFLTKENTTPNGKKHLFIHACPEDVKLRSDVFDKILSFKQGFRFCLWYSDDPDDVFSEDGKEKLREMAVIIPVITENYFRLFEEEHSDVSPSGLFEDLQLGGTAVMPLLQNADLLIHFNRLFGELHGISLSLPNAERMAEDQLMRLLSDNILEERITKEAFTGKLFLSYRKKDFKEARQIMKAIHDTDAAGSAAIWFDEFLVAGRDFNEGILDSLTASDAMVLSVTPNLLEKNNYVREKEYKYAVDHGIDVLPVEAVRTDDKELADAFPGIRPRTDMNDKNAMEELLKKAGFRGPGSQSPFAEYLLGMAFLIPVNVEKDVERAVRLFDISADHNCAEACEQLGKMYVSGLGVKRDYDKGIRYKKKAFDLLMCKAVTEENIRHINRLLFEFDGLPLLLKENGRVREANRIQQAFLDRVSGSSFGKRDEFILYRVNALTDLANLFYEYDLDTGRRKQTVDEEENEYMDMVNSYYPGNANAGPSEGELNRARQYADWALNLLDTYHGDDQDMADFLRVVTYDQYADLCKFRGDLSEAISWKEKSRELIEPLASRTGNLEYMDRSFQISNNLGLFYREEMLNTGKSEEKRKTAARQLDTAVKKARQLINLNPEFRGRLVTALSNRTLVSADAQESKQYAAECYDVFLSLLKDLDISAKEAWTMRHIGGEFSAAVDNITTFTTKKDRKPVFEKHYGKVPAGTGIAEFAGRLNSLLLTMIILVLFLQLTGLFDANKFLTGRLGDTGTMIFAGIVVVLYGITFFLKRK